MDENNLYDKKVSELNATNNLAAKLANLFFIISSVCLILTGFIAFSFLGLILYYLTLVIILLLTLFFTFNKIMEWFEKGEIIQQFLSTMFQYLPYLIGVGFISAILALTLFIINKNYAHRTAKIITTSVIIVLYIIATMLRFIVFAGN